MKYRKNNIRGIHMGEKLWVYFIYDMTFQLDLKAECFPSETVRGQGALQLSKWDR